MKKLFNIMLCSVLLLGACSESDSDEGLQLSMPRLSEENVGEESFTVTWNAVENASIYLYSLDGGEETATTKTSVSFDGLTAGTQYTVTVTAVSSDTNYAASKAATIVVTTLEEDLSGRIESDLFDSLVGEWVGKQTVKYAVGISTSGFVFETHDWTFDVNIYERVETHKFRKENYLCCVGIGDFKDLGDDRSYEDLIQSGFTEEAAIEGFGPKWFLKLKEDGSIVVEATTKFTVLSYYVDEENGPMYLLGGADDAYYSELECELPVVIEGNELRVTSAEIDGKTWSPSMFSWHPKQGAYARYYLGVSDIVLERKK